MSDKFLFSYVELYGTLQGIFWMNISQRMLVWLNQKVLAHHFCTIWSGWQKGTSKLNTVHWLDVMLISSGFIGAYILQPQFQFYGRG
jgi:hypothetical protein